MLCELYIKDLAIIEEAEIQFHSGMSCFTGETGAGKSILINGIGAVMGKRVSKDIVRNGAMKSVISARFTNLSQEITEQLRNYGINSDEDELFLSREIHSDGGSTARINGKSAPISLLKELGTLLITIHGQHDNQLLMQPEFHLNLLDEFAHNETLILEYQNSFSALQKCARSYNKLLLDEQKNIETKSRLQATIQDIKGLNLKKNEDEIIESEIQKFQSVEFLSQNLQICRGILKYNTDCVLEDLQTVRSALDKVSDILKEKAELPQRIRSVSLELEDICNEIEESIDSLEMQPERYQMLMARRDAILKIEQKYFCSNSDELICLLEQSEQELAKMKTESEIEHLKQQRAQLLQESSQKAKQLSIARAEAAERLSSYLEEELAQLDMPNVKIIPKFQHTKLTPKGTETLELLIQSNQGEEAKSISKIASGGELSRIMLAFRSISSKADRIPTIIFDEIDTGVSGRAAQKIGNKLRDISKDSQVICVTHLSQIAVCAQNHYLIEKNSDGTRTKTHIYELSAEERIPEIARITNGDSVDAVALKNAENELKKHGNI